MVGTGTGGFSSGTEAMYSGTEEVPRKKEKKKKVKKETVLNREKAYYDQHGTTTIIPHPLIKTCIANQ